MLYQKLYHIFLISRKEMNLSDPILIPASIPAMSMYDVAYQYKHDKGMIPGTGTMYGLT